MTTANSLTGAIVDYIRMQHCHAERVNNYSRTVKDKYGNDRYIPSAGFKGTADIHACKIFQVILTARKTDISTAFGIGEGWKKYGLFVAIEVKIGRDKLSEAQEYYRECVTKAGGVYMVVHTWDEFIEKWNEI